MTSFDQVDLDLWSSKDLLKLRGRIDVVLDSRRRVKVTTLIDDTKWPELPDDKLVEIENRIKEIRYDRERGTN